MNEATFTLVYTAEDGVPITLPVTVRASGGILEVSPRGYGECAAVDGAGAPVVLDLTPDGLKVHVFGDINSEEPTDTVDLEGAREDRRWRWFIKGRGRGYAYTSTLGFVSRAEAEAELARQVVHGIIIAGEVVPAEE